MRIGSPQRRFFSLSCASFLLVTSLAAQSLNGCLSARLLESNLAKGAAQILVESRCPNRVTAYALSADCPAPAGSSRECGKLIVDFWPSIGLGHLLPSDRADEAGGIRPGKDHVSLVGISRPDTVAALELPPVVRVTAYVLEDLTAFGDTRIVGEILRKRAASLSELLHWRGILKAEVSRMRAQGLEQVDVRPLRGRGRVESYQASARLAAQVIGEEVFARMKPARAPDGESEIADLENIEACLRFLEMRIQNGSGHVPKELLQ